AASLKLFPLPASTCVAMVGLASLHDAIELLSRAKDAAGSGLEAFELISRLGLELVIKHIPGSADPLAAPHAWYALIEVTGDSEGGAETTTMALLERGMEAGLVEDAVVARSVSQAKALWALRENQSAGQKAEGPAWKNDISIPVAQIAQFVDEAQAALERFSPGVRLSPFGHAGDGNLHFDILAAEGASVADHLARREESHRIVNDLVERYQGSISAEHGLGVMKTQEALGYKQPAQVSAMQAIRAALDPNRIMNPRVLF
ncbi:MAG TPA: FAD-linked oxidase C-terminal domain-containing protein, partial [Caulobacteraceae bacterium]|nr:FAD-linked oxidase C-terminal domain-containing protein [Caulobacteraceae bacterium]